MTIAEQDTRVEGLGRLAHAMARFDTGTASRIAAEAERTALAVAEPDMRADALASLVYPLSEIDGESATRVADAAVRTAHAITTTATGSGRTLSLVGADLCEGQMWEAEAVIGDIEDPYEQAFLQDWSSRKLIDAAVWDRAERAIQILTEPDRVTNISMPWRAG